MVVSSHHIENLSSKRGSPFITPEHSEIRSQMGGIREGWRPDLGDNRQLKVSRCHRVVEHLEMCDWRV